MLKCKSYRSLFALVFLITTSTAFADKTVTMNFTAENGVGKKAGTIQIAETQYGLLLTPHLYGLPPGVHGFHIHQYSSCAQNGMAAGSHLDPHLTDKHLGPYAEGHEGDLPILYVAPDGTATTPTLAPRFKRIAEIMHHTLMIHQGGDNYADVPEKNGGGATRIVCGVIS